jgi:heme oxygenase (biliverdin-producing, ferredoxin)
MSDRVWAASQVHHDEVRRTPFVVALTFARLPWSAYADWLAQLYFMHEFLAEAEEVMADDPIGLAMARSAAISLPALAADLDYFHGLQWKHRIVARPVTTVYCTHLRDVAVREIRGFVAHHYARHIEDLGTAPELAQAVASTYRLADAGCRFLAPADTDLMRYRDRYHRLLQAQSWSPTETETLVSDTATVHRMYLNVVQELGRSWY